MTPVEREELARRFNDDETVDRLVKLAVYKALKRHKRLGNSVAVWIDGRAVWLPAKDIPIEKP